MNPGKPDRPQPVPLPRRMVSANGGDRSIRPVAPHHRKDRCPPTPVNKPVRIEKRCTPAQTTQERNDISAPSGTGLIPVHSTDIHFLVRPQRRKF